LMTFPTVMPLAGLSHLSPRWLHSVCHRQRLSLAFLLLLDFKLT
jgi:hypothetical protein